MKRIKNAAHLNHEKLNLRVQELEQEKILRADWKEIKENLQPANLLQSKLTEHGEGNWLVKGLHVAASSLTNKILQKAGEKIEDGTDRGIEFLGRRMTTIFKRKK